MSVEIKFPQEKEFERLKAEWEFVYNPQASTSRLGPTNWQGGYHTINQHSFSGSVNEPAHYKANDKQLWDVMKDMVPPDQYVGYLKLNIIKYLHRYKDKGGKESLEKARAYLNKLIDTEYPQTGETK